MQPILFISHDASRTGAPAVLLTLCRWLAKHHARGFEFLLGDGGDLESGFATLAPTTVVGRLANPDRAMARLEPMADRIARGEFALVYANTVETGECLEACASADVPAIGHVHELDFRIRHQTGLERFALVRDHCDRFIAASEAVRTNLVTSHGLGPASIDVVHEFVDTRRWTVDPTDDSPARGVLDIPESAFVVGGSGTLDWRKGPDVFVQVAGAVQRRAPSRPVHWVWVGGQTEGQHVDALRYDAEKLGVAAQVHFVGEQRDPVPYFALFDLFLSSSREDPFPIVALEAAASAAPIVCFDGAGGARELVEDDCGTCVPYLDIASMADAIVAFLSSETRRRQCGDRARAKVRERHDVSVAAPAIAAIIESAIEAGPSPERLTRMAARAMSSCPIASASAQPAPDEAMIAWYRTASACASNGQVDRARALFETIIDAASATNPELAGKAWFKLATLDVSPDEAIRCCDRALALAPNHDAARRLRDTLTHSEPAHG